MNSAMNIIPTTFNEQATPYTIIGGLKNDKADKAFLSAIILNRGSRYYLSSTIQTLYDIGITSIISVDFSKKIFDTDKLLPVFPSVKFLIPTENISIGEMINLGMAELNSDYVLILWNDSVFQQIGLFKNALENIDEECRICTTPLITNQKNEALFTQIIPVALIGENSFSTEPMQCIRDGTKTIYAFDFMGIYNRSSFIHIGGFDHTMKNPYWQNLDFGLRASLWGYTMKTAVYFKMQYCSTTPVEDTTPDDSYRTFYLKNLAPVIKENKASLPFSLFFPYCKQSGLNFINAYKYFKAGRNWVNTHKDKFKISAYELAADWRPQL